MHLQIIFIFNYILFEKICIISYWNIFICFPNASVAGYIFSSVVTRRKITRTGFRSCHFWNPFFEPKAIAMTTLVFQNNLGQVQGLNVSDPLGSPEKTLRNHPWILDYEKLNLPAYRIFGDPLTRHHPHGRRVRHINGATIYFLILINSLSATIYFLS